MPRKSSRVDLTKVLLVLAVCGLLAVSIFIIRSDDGSRIKPGSSLSTSYNPQIDPGSFTNVITNPLMSLPVGKKLTYEGAVDEGIERIEIEIEPGAKTLMGVKTLTYRDKVYLNNELVEDTRDYLAQDRAGNVWYFGEDVNNYKKGAFKDNKGSWLAGENGALPGIWLKTEHVIGDSYRQEYYKGQAEDMRDIIALNQTVKTKRATYHGCLKVYDWTPLDSESREHKYYCPEVKGEVLIEDIETGDTFELVSVVEP